MSRTGWIHLLLATVTIAGCRGGSASTDGGTFQDVSPEARGDIGATSSFRHQIFEHVFQEPISPAATGDFFTPAYSYPPIPVDPKYTHVLSFQLYPWAFPLRAAEITNGPVVLFSDTFETLIFSPMDHFFVSLVDVRDGEIRFGIEGEVESIPAGFRHRFLLVEGQGINATVEEWGRLLREDRGIGVRDRYADEAMGTLGYWTDNGAAYFYDTLPGAGYEETLLAVKDDADARGIPYGYFQVDSWWYFRGPDTSGRKGGIHLWEPDPAVLPNGLAALHEKLGLPLVAHSKWFEPDNGYLDKYTFQSGEAWAVPVGKEIFDEMLSNAADWGIITYEPDWLLSHYLWEIPWLRQGVDRVETWMANQAAAASENGLSMQLCMAGAGHLMDALDRVPVLTFRSSIDYHRDTSKESYWPMFHTVNMLTSAIGIWPFKDNFWSSETCGEQEALISTLSAGMVGVGDPVGEAVPEILLRTCRADGVLLKPARTATPLDAMFLPHERPYTVSTWSQRTDLPGRWHYVAGFHLAREHPDMSPVDQAFALLTYDGRDLGEMFVWPDAVEDWTLDLASDLGIQGSVVAYDWRSGAAKMATGTAAFKPFEDLYDFGYLLLAPIQSNGLAFIGEPAKYVTLADRRFAAIEMDPDGFSVSLTGAPGEAVAVLAFDTTDGSLLHADTVVGANGTGSVRVGRGDAAR